MKKLNLFGILLMAFLTFSACSSDDDNVNTEDPLENENPNDSENPEDEEDPEEVYNHFIFGDSEIALVDGMVEYFGDWTGTGSQNFDLTLVNAELSGPENEYIPVEDVFSAIYFELFTDNPTDIAVGTYEFAETAAAGTFAAAFVALNIDINNPSEEGIKQIMDGTLTVIQNGDNYEFEFSGSTVEGTAVNLYFEGALNQVNFSVTDRTTNENIKNNKFLSLRK